LPRVNTAANEYNTDVSSDGLMSSARWATTSRPATGDHADTCGRKRFGFAWGCEAIAGPCAPRRRHSRWPPQRPGGARPQSRPSWPEFERIR
jgi:hypothetical protein